LKARVHDGPGGKLVWVVNPTRTERHATISLASHLGAFASGEDLWGGRKVDVRERTVDVIVGDRDVAVILLK
jgi:hypothetical protein